MIMMQLSHPTSIVSRSGDKMLSPPYTKLRSDATLNATLHRGVCKNKDNLPPRTSSSTTQIHFIGKNTEYLCEC
jgi:hypothetical protein